MPYIEPSRRKQLSEGSPPLTPGELNFCITAVVHDYVRREKFNYDTLNSALGVMDAARSEFYRVVVAPYEDIKRAVNGPVSSLDEGFKPSASPQFNYNHQPGNN